jgi:hypothetical protein
MKDHTFTNTAISCKNPTGCQLRFSGMANPGCNSASCPEKALHSMLESRISVKKTGQFMLAISHLDML